MNESPELPPPPSPRPKRGRPRARKTTAVVMLSRRDLQAAIRRELQSIVDVLEERFLGAASAINGGGDTQHEVNGTGTSSGNLGGTGDVLTVAEAAARLRKKPFTVREWCRLGRINAKLLPNGQEWRISAAEIARLRAEGLLEMDLKRNKPGSGK
jgi:hypothetical protein